MTESSVASFTPATWGRARIAFEQGVVVLETAGAAIENEGDEGEPDLFQRVMDRDHASGLIRQTGKLTRRMDEQRVGTARPGFVPHSHGLPDHLVGPRSWIGRKRGTRRRRAASGNDDGRWWQCSAPRGEHLRARVRIEVQPAARVGPHGHAADLLSGHPPSVHLLRLGVQVPIRAARDRNRGHQGAIEPAHQLARTRREGVRCPGHEGAPGGRI